MKKITIQSPCGTIALMEYIRDHENDFIVSEQVFVYEDVYGHKRIKFVFHKCDPNNWMEEPKHLRTLFGDPESWFDYQGMKRYTGDCNCWYFYINNQYYFVTD